ncbi:MAG: DUF2953 domain-containing protein [Oscillospiraceae bacterium]|nr:DUF2953 domain-containing protein [Oscillospiraceae bacterium]
MLTLFIIIAILLIIALLRFGVHVEYSSEGVVVKIFAGIFSFRVYPQKEDTPEQAQKNARKKAKKEAASQKKKDKPPFKMPGGLKGFLDLIPPLRNMLRRVKRRILIKELTVYCTFAGTDASQTAITYGMANAVMGTLAPVLDHHFRIRHRDFQTGVDFTSSERKIYVSAAISLAVWESIYIIVALLPMLRIFFKRDKTQKDTIKQTVNNEHAGKDDIKNGKASN